MLLRKVLFTALLLVSFPALASLDIEITGAGEHQIPISVVPFAGEEKLAQKISEVIANDLRRSGLFKIVDGAGKLPHEMSDVKFGRMLMH
jgi:TolB protein